MSFGEDFPGRDDPLDGTVKVLEHDSGVYQYFMKVVPTEYVSHSTAKSRLEKSILVWE